MLFKYYFSLQLYSIITFAVQFSIDKLRVRLLNESAKVSTLQRAHLLDLFR